MQLRPAQGRFLWLILLVLLVGGAAATLAPRLTANPDRLWEEAESDLLRGRIDRAASVVARLSRLREPTPLDWMLRAQLALAQNRVDDALKALANVPDSHYMAAQARLLAGQAELRRSRLPAAEKMLLAAVRLEPGLVKAHRELIYIYGYQLRRAELNEQFRTLGELTPLTFDNIFHWCLTRNNLWEPGSLLKDMERFVQGDPNDRWSRVGLAECLRRLGRGDEAEKVVALMPQDDPEAIAVRVRLAFEEGDFDRASKLLALGPANYPELARLRGRLATTRRDYKTGLEYYQTAYAADPDNRDTLFGLANAYRALGRADEGAPYVEAAQNYDRLGSVIERSASYLGKSHVDPALLRQLGAACESVGHDAEARACYKLAIAENPLDPESQQALFRVDAKIEAKKAKTPPQPKS